MRNGLKMKLNGCVLNASKVMFGMILLQNALLVTNSLIIVMIVSKLLRENSISVHHVMATCSQHMINSNAWNIFQTATLKTVLIPTLSKTMNTIVSTVLETLFGIQLHLLVSLVMFTLKVVRNAERTLMEMLSAWSAKILTEILLISLISLLKMVSDVLKESKTA